MLLRQLRRLHRLLVPLQVAAMVAFAVRLGWGHDPKCPHHARGAAHTAQSEHATHLEHAAHGGHAAQSAPAATADAPQRAAPDAAPTDGSKDNCHCLDKGYCLGGATAIPQFAAAAPLADAILRWVDPAQPVSEPLAVSDVYRSHRLPFPHAPPCTVACA